MRMIGVHRLYANEVALSVHALLVMMTAILPWCTSLEMLESSSKRISSQEKGAMHLKVRLHGARTETRRGHSHRSRARLLLAVSDVLHRATCV
jgi:hypothetical protein